jgi:HK97 family phage major capsid protein
MKEVHEIEQELSKLENQKAELVKIDTKDITDENLDQLDEVNKQITAKQKELHTAKRKEAFEAEKVAASLAGGAGVEVIDGETKEIENQEYSVVKAIREACDKNVGLSGFELEMHQEAVKEAQATGKSVTNGAIAIPQKLMVSKAMSVGSAADGGSTVDTMKKGWIDTLKDKTVLRGLGAQFLTGLQGDIEFDRQTSDVTFSWVGENDAASESTPGTDKVTLTPKRLSGYSRLSSQLLAQSSYDIEQKVRNSMIYGQARAFDLAGTSGSGVAPIPEGFLNTTGIGSVPTGALSYDKIVELESAVAIDNADIGNMAYIFNAAVRGSLKTTQKFSATNGVSLMENNEVNGYGTGVTNLMPASTIGFGNFNSLLMGLWANGMEIIVDPYTRSKQAQVDLVMHFWGDTAVEHPESFASFVIS